MAQYWLLTVSPKKSELPRNTFCEGFLSLWCRNHPDDIILYATPISKEDYDVGVVPQPTDGRLIRGSDDYRIIKNWLGFSRFVDWLHEQLRDSVHIPLGITGKIYGDHCQDVPLVAFYFETTNREWNYYWKVNERLNDSLKDAERLEWVPKLKDQVQKAVESLISHVS